METEIKREGIYLGIKNDHGHIEPMIGKKLEVGKHCIDLITGEILENEGEIYATLDGFPSCKIDTMLEAWGYGEKVTTEDLKHLKKAILSWPTLLQIAMIENRIGEAKTLQDELWTIRHMIKVIEKSNDEVVEVKNTKDYDMSYSELSMQQDRRRLQKIRTKVKTIPFTAKEKIVTRKRG